MNDSIHALTEKIRAVKKQVMDLQQEEYKLESQLLTEIDALFMQTLADEANNR